MIRERLSVEGRRGQDDRGPAVTFPPGLEKNGRTEVRLQAALVEFVKDDGSRPWTTILAKHT